MNITAFAIQKGGVGKTTSSINFASFLAMRNHKTLLIDFDSQANATSTLLDAVPDTTVQHVIIDEIPAQKAIVPSRVPMLDVLPSDIGFAKAEWKLMSGVDQMYHLRDAIYEHKLDSIYEHIVIDSPPTLGILTFNVLCAAQYVMIPVTCENFSVKGLIDFMDTIEKVRARPNRELRVLGIFLNMYDSRKNLHQGLATEVERHFGNLVFSQTIRQSIKIGEANIERLPIFLYAKTSPAAEDFGNLCTEAYERLNSLFTHAPAASLAKGAAS